MVLHKSKLSKSTLKMKRTEVFKIYDFTKFKHKQDLEQKKRNEIL